MPLATSQTPPDFPLRSLTELTRDSARELIAELRDEQDRADARVEKWLDRCDKYTDKMRDG